LGRYFKTFFTLKKYDMATTKREIKRASDIYLGPAAKKKSKKMDALLVAAKEHHESEVKYIAKHYKIHMAEVRKAMRLAGKNGKPSRSRKNIYAQLRLMGYPIKTRTTK
jgi:hypothetical protein